MKSGSNRSVQTIASPRRLSAALPPRPPAHVPTCPAGVEASAAPCDSSRLRSQGTSRAACCGWRCSRPTSASSSVPASTGLSRATLLEITEFSCTVREGRRGSGEGGRQCLSMPQPLDQCAGSDNTPMRQEWLTPRPALTAQASVQRALIAHLQRLRQRRGHRRHLAVVREAKETCSSARSHACIAPPPPRRSARGRPARQEASCNLQVITERQRGSCMLKRVTSNGGSCSNLNRA